MKKKADQTEAPPDQSDQDLQEQAVQFFIKMLRERGESAFRNGCNGSGNLENALGSLLEEGQGHRCIWLDLGARVVEITFRYFTRCYIETVTTPDELAVLLGTTKDKLEKLFRGSHTPIPRPNLPPV
ncbi:MAG: hypothetical protein ABIH35_00095 [Patescibacteria group bacterium]